MCVNINGPGDRNLWPFDLETGIWVASKAENLSSKFGHARPLGSRIIRCVRNRRTDWQTDGRTKATLIAPFATDGGIIIPTALERIATLSKPAVDWSRAALSATVIFLSKIARHVTWLQRRRCSVRVPATSRHKVKRVAHNYRRSPSSAGNLPRRRRSLSDSWKLASRLQQRGRWCWDEVVTATDDVVKPVSSCTVCRRRREAGH